MTEINYSATIKWLIIFCLVLAGEMIFSLPFHLARFFRPTFLAVFNLSNTELGDILSIYGIMAMLAYFPGGSIADRFSPGKLMAVSLLATGLGGIYLAQLPGKTGMAILFGYWGITTIFLFWAAMIKATREWGGKLSQGKAFGILDGGRGLVAAAVASIAVLLFSTTLGGETNNILPEQRVSAFQMIIYLYSFLTMGTALLIWLIIPESKEIVARTSNNILRGVKTILKNKQAWLQAVIVVCAYCGYKGIDNYSLYGTIALDMNEIEAARFVSNASYLRVVAAIVAGLIADRLKVTKVISYTFLMLIICYLLLSFFEPKAIVNLVIMMNLIITFAAVYALRGVYFALLEESNIASNQTGTAVGLISLIGFTPDIFFYSVTGRILDASPGLSGFQNYFMLLAIIALAGMTATLMLSRKI